jgi:hypothetical protein
LTGIAGAAGLDLALNERWFYSLWHVLIKDSSLEKTLSCLTCLSSLLPGAVLAIAASVLSRPTQLNWRWVAVWWCIAVVFFECTERGASMFFHLAYSSPGAWIGHGAYVFFVMGTIIFLSFGSPLARTIALLLAVLSGVLAWRSSWHLPSLINSSVQMLMYSVPPHFLRQEYRYIFSDLQFLGSFVQPVAMVGPWLLIALYARYVPMRFPPEDGTSFPRRYCGKCWYNLRGLAPNRCPECGAEFHVSSNIVEQLAEFEKWTLAERRCEIPELRPATPSAQKGD